jgi:hypothetical protein
VVLEHPGPPSGFAEDIPPALDAAVLKALEKTPEHRFESARAFARALADAVPLAHEEDVAVLMDGLFSEQRMATAALLETLSSEGAEERTVSMLLAELVERSSSSDVQPQAVVLGSAAPTRQERAYVPGVKLTPSPVDFPERDEALDVTQIDRPAPRRGAVSLGTEPLDRTRQVNAFQIPKWESPPSPGPTVPPVAPSAPRPPSSSAWPPPSPPSPTLEMPVPRVAPSAPRPPASSARDAPAAWPPPSPPSPTAEMPVPRAAPSAPRPSSASARPSPFDAFPLAPAPAPRAAASGPRPPGAASSEAPAARPPPSGPRPSTAAPEAQPETAARAAPSGPRPAPASPSEPPAPRPPPSGPRPATAALEASAPAPAAAPGAAPESVASESGRPRRGQPASAEAPPKTDKQAWPSLDDDEPIDHSAVSLLTTSEKIRWVIALVLLTIAIGVVVAFVKHDQELRQKPAAAVDAGVR